MFYKFLNRYSKEDYFYFFLFLFIICIFAVQCCLFGGNFFSAWDEAYCLLKCRDAYDGIVTGKSQWDLIAVKWFAYFDLTHKIAACWASAILILATLGNVIFALSMLTHKISFFKGASVGLLCLLPIIGGGYAAEVQTHVGWVTGINYLVLQVFLLESAIAFFLVYLYHSHPVVSRVFLLCSAILSMLSVFVILPSGVLITCCLALLVLVKEGKIWNKYCDTILLALGIVFALIYVHIFIAPLNVIHDEMMFTASYITKCGFGYTPFDFLKNILRTFVEYLVYFPILLGLWYLTTKIKMGILSTFSLLVYMWFIIYITYKRLAFMPTIPFLACTCCIIAIQFFENNRHKSFQQIIVFLFLLISPLICAMGTNTDLWGRIGCFIIPWGILLLFSDNLFHFQIDKKIAVCFISLLLIPLTLNTVRLYYHHKKYYTTHFVTGNPNMIDISVTPEQKVYFEKIQTIVNQYGYQPRKSLVFAAAHNWCAVYALDAELSSRFHVPQNFSVYPKERMKRPDFLILSQQEETLFNLKELSWGWPEEYDVYEIGTPETICQKFLNSSDVNRNLYCRKSLKRLHVPETLKHEN